METLEIESTERTPGIKFDYDHHYFEINGEAYPENSDEFFSLLWNHSKSILVWVLLKQ